MRLAGVPLPDTSAITSPRRPALQRDEVVVVAPDLEAGAAHRHHLESLDRRRGPREEALLDLAGDLQVAVLPLLLDAHAVRTRGLDRGLGLARQGGREVDVLLAEGPAARPLPHREEAAQPLPGRERHRQREARAREGVLERPLGKVRHAPRARQVAQERRGVALHPPRRLARLHPRACARSSPLGAQAVQGAARGEEVAHDRRGHQTLDRLLVQAGRQLAPDVEQAVELVHLDGERAVDPAELLVDQPVLDGGRGAGGEALEKARLLRAEGPPLGPRPEAEERDRPARLPHRADEGEAGLRESRVGRPGGERPLGHVGPLDRLRRPGAESPRRAAAVAAVLPGHVERAARNLQLAHHDQERRVEDLRAAERRAEGRAEVEQRDQLRHALEEGRLAPLAPELVERLLVLEDDGRRHGTPPRFPRPACSSPCSTRCGGPRGGTSRSP